MFYSPGRLLGLNFSVPTIRLVGLLQLVFLTGLGARWFDMLGVFRCTCAMCRFVIGLAEWLALAMTCVGDSPGPLLTLLLLMLLLVPVIPDLLVIVVLFGIRLAKVPGVDS